MEVAAPSSRAPRALRGHSLARALRELGDDGDAVPAAVVESRRSLPAAPAFPEPPPPEEDTGPPALRPQELARWLDRRRR